MPPAIACSQFASSQRRALRFPAGSGDPLRAVGMPTPKNVRPRREEPAELVPTPWVAPEDEVARADAPWSLPMVWLWGHP